MGEFFKMQCYPLAKLLANPTIIARKSLLLSLVASYFRLRQTQKNTLLFVDEFFITLIFARLKVYGVVCFFSALLFSYEYTINTILI